MRRRRVLVPELLVYQALEALLSVPSRLELTVVVEQDLSCTLGRLVSIVNSHRCPQVKFFL